MSKYGEPWIVGKGIYSDMIYRSDGAAIAKAANRLKAEEYDLCNERIASCVNALAGIPHPEHLPEMLAAVRAGKAAGQKARAAYIAMMGKTT